MIDRNIVLQKLRGFSFDGYSKVVEKLLSAYGIVGVTIQKIIHQIEKGDKGPFYVYRRAIILCSNGTDCHKDIEQNKNVFPLTIVFCPTIISVANERLGEVDFRYEEIGDYLEYFEPLGNWGINKNDHYRTLELDTIVESLYRALKMDDNDEENIRKFIFSLLYISHFKCMLNLDNITKELDDYAETDEHKLSTVFQCFFDMRCPFVADIVPCIVLSKESYKYVFSIIKFDTNLVDAEILTSLIYRMTEKDDAGLYGHQTTFTNVEKLLRPLFLDKLQVSIQETKSKEAILCIIKEIYEITIFDPTNSPGCYLVEAYIGLTQLLRDVEQQFGICLDEPLNLKKFVCLVENNLTAELTRFALTFTHTKELKRLNIMNQQAICDLYGQLNIHVSNQLATDWQKFVVPNEHTYIVGCPQFKGCNKLEAAKKLMMQKIFKSEALNNADYCTAWLIKSAQFISGTKAEAAYVLTNSVAQGSQSSNILNKVNEFGCEYIYAYRSFKWKVSSSDNVGVTVVIIGISAFGNRVNKYLFDNGKAIKCKEIGASLLPDIDIRIKKRSNAIGPISSCLPPMRKGNMPDGAANILTFSPTSVDDFISKYPKAEKFIKPLYGGDEFVSGEPSWCLWITNDNLSEALKIDGIRNRVEEVRKKRANSTSGTKSKENPHAFREQNVTTKGKVSIIVPCVTSEHREYFQMGILGSEAIVNNNVNVIFNCDIWVLALLESRMHLVWAKNAAGGHESRPRYSSELCYNTFPAPNLDKKQKATLANLAKTLLEVREKYCDRSLGSMYKDMPIELKRVHHWIDETVDSFYRNQPFENDGERLVWLKTLYNTVTENE